MSSKEVVATRREDDPYVRDELLVRLREGLTFNEACKIVSVKPNIVMQLLAQDKDFNKAVEQARGSVFDPVIKHALSLAMEADALGENEGAHKAMTLVFKYFSQEQDRKNAQVVAHIKASAETGPQIAIVPSLSGPAATKQLVQEILKQEQALEATQQEDGTYVTD